MQKQAQERFAAHIENPKEGKALPSEYAVPVYKIVLKAGGQQEFDQVKRRCRVWNVGRVTLSKLAHACLACGGTINSENVYFFGSRDERWFVFVFWEDVVCSELAGYSSSSGSNASSARLSCSSAIGLLRLRTPACAEIWWHRAKADCFQS